MSRTGVTYESGEELTKYFMHKIDGSEMPNNDRYAKSRSKNHSSFTLKFNRVSKNLVARPEYLFQNFYYLLLEKSTCCLPEPHDLLTCFHPRPYMRIYKAYADLFVNKSKSS